MMLRSHLVDKVRFDLESMEPGKKGLFECVLLDLSTATRQIDLATNLQRN